MTSLDKHFVTGLLTGIVFSTIIYLSVGRDLYIEANQKVSACEAELPRHKHCIHVISAKVAND